MVKNNESKYELYPPTNFDKLNNKCSKQSLVVCSKNVLCQTIYHCVNLRED